MIRNKQILVSYCKNNNTVGLHSKLYKMMQWLVLMRNSSSFTRSLYVYAGFLLVLRFPPTGQKQVYAKLYVCDGMD